MLTDDDKMLFGIHKGKAMANVPAKYLLWFYDELKQRQSKGLRLNSAELELHEYISDNLDILKNEKDNCYKCR
jgi:uncharacterized protein (DUF3820 family)